jgi:ribosome-associated translation inhibitor RaiA
MSRLDFHIEFYTERTELPDGLEVEADSRLRALAADHKDIIGASVAVEELTGEETPNFFEARVIAYVRPDNIVAIEKGGNVETALRGALEALERQIRKRRAYLREKSRPETEEGVNVGPYQLTGRELYDAYAQDVPPEELLNRTRVDIATELMAQQGLSEEEAYYATDEILTFAQESIEAGPP